MDEDMTTPEEATEESKEKSISADLIRGHINTIILRTLYDGDKYGYEIMAEVSQKSHGQYTLKEPSMYSALKRLEKEGYVTSYWGGSVGGGRRKYYSLTEEGREIVEQNQSEWEYSRTIIDALISDRDFDFSNPAPTAVNMRMLRSTTSRVPSRGDENDELDYEPAFDDSDERERRAAEYAQQAAELEAERKKLEEDRQRFEEEMQAKNSAYMTECESRERELADRERDVEEKRRQLEELEESYRLASETEQEQDAAEEAEFDERVRLFEEEETARKSALEEEETERRRVLEEEEAARRAALEAEESERRRILDEEEARRKYALEAEESERRRILDEEESDRRAALEAEEDARRRAVDDEIATRMEALAAEEEARRAALEEETSHSRELETQAQEQLRLREQEMREREAYYIEERARLAEEIHRRDETIAAERTAHAKELEAQEARIVREQEELFRAREQELIHQNYRDLVSAPPPPATPEAGSYSYYTAPIAPVVEEPQAPVESTPPPATPATTTVEPPRDYRNVVQDIYSGTVTSSREDDDRTESATSLDGIDFHDLESRAAHDGIRVTTAGGSKTTKKATEDSYSIVHKGKALFLSAIVVFCLCVIEGAIAYGLRDEIGIPIFHPFFIWFAGLALLIVTLLAYANRYGERSIRRNDCRIWINAIVIYVLLVLVTLIVALGVGIDTFTNMSALATYVIVPIIFFFGVVVFGVCYYLLTRPKKN